MPDECFGLFVVKLAQEADDRLGVAAAHFGESGLRCSGERDDDPPSVLFVVVAVNEAGPSQFPYYQAGVRDSHLGALGQVGDAEWPADGKGDQHPDVTRAELGGGPEFGRDVRSAALVGEHYLRQQRSQSGNMAVQINQLSLTIY